MRINLEATNKKSAKFSSLMLSPVEHRGSSSLGYRFEELPRRPFLPEKAEALGVPSGPWRKDLVAGKSIILPGGRRIQPMMF